MNKALDKLLSARFWMSILFTVGFLLLSAAAMWILRANEGSVMGLVAAVGLITKEIVKNYFDRNDREAKPNV